MKIPLVLVPMLRVGMQGAALRADIPKAKFVRQISVPQLMDTPNLNLSSRESRDLPELSERRTLVLPGRLWLSMTFQNTVCRI
ncbi:MAG: hypothetical protein GY749_44025 [Desulfobacteraceae bacterium]|nr:hypothetical protein [Desulfobacteraceae bacterium]